VTVARVQLLNGGYREGEKKRSCFTLLRPSYMHIRISSFKFWPKPLRQFNIVVTYLVVNGLGLIKDEGDCDKHKKHK
jgi:hypothetical protein